MFFKAIYLAADRLKIVLSSWWIIPFINILWHSLSLIMFFALKFVLLYINIATSTLVSICVAYLFPSLSMPLCFRYDFYEQNLDKFWIFKCNKDSHMFHPVTFIVMNDTLGFIYITLSWDFSLILLFSKFFFSFLAFFFSISQFSKFFFPPADLEVIYTFFFLLQMSKVSQ